MRRDMERMFESLSGFAGTRTAGVFPPINVYDTPDGVRIRAEIPGVKPEDLDVRVESGTLTIAGERQPDEDGNVAYHRREREWGRFRRSFSLPVPIDSGGVEARYDNGILTIELPKAAEARPKQIAVQAGA